MTPTRAIPRDPTTLMEARGVEAMVDWGEERGLVDNVNTIWRAMYDAAPETPAKRSCATRRPCDRCGWAEHMAIHQNGDMKLNGESWGHQYIRALPPSDV